MTRPSSLPRKAVFPVLFLALAAVFAGTPPAEPLAPLGYSWSCASRFCSFQVTTNNHGAYQWNFGDGTLTGITTSKSASHFFNVPVDNQFHTSNVQLIGYSTPTAGSPDNIVGCDIVFAAATVGIGTSGSCN